MANEKRLIDANALLERLKFKRAISERGLYRGLESAMAQVNKAPHRGCRGSGACVLAH